MNAFSLTRPITTSGIVFTGGGWLAGVMVRASALGAIITLYDGKDDADIRQRIVISAKLTESTPEMFAVPVRFDSGLYVKVGSNITDCNLIILQDKPG